MQELFPVRGYLSSVEPSLIFAMGQAEQADVTITWPDGLQEVLRSVPAGASRTVRHGGVPARVETAAPPPGRFVPLEGTGLEFRHRENAFDDFERAPLIPHMLSREGPALAVGDLNQDGLDDVFVGGARGQEAGLFLQQSDGSFMPVALEALRGHRSYEDVDALLFDSDGDTDLDLYVATGGSSEPEGDPAYQDRLYINAGFGLLEYRPEALPEMHTSTSVVAAHDFDQDGDQDLFVGGRVRPGSYPHSPRSYLLAGSSEGFVDVTRQVSPALVRPGMVTDAIWSDLTGNGRAELVLAGEWMPVRVFAFGESGQMEEITDDLDLVGTSGFWSSLAAGDLDGDGDNDLVAGNRGLNTQIKVSPTMPASIYAADFDRSGTLDAIMSAFVEGLEVPVHWRDAVVTRMPSFARRFPTHESYATADMQEFFTEAEHAAALRLRAHMAASTAFENLEGRMLRSFPLPERAQVAPVQDLVMADFNGDTYQDLVLVGNQFGMRAAVGRQDAGRGLLLLGDGRMGLTSAGPAGMHAAQDARKVRLIQRPGDSLVLVASSDGALEVYRLR